MPSELNILRRFFNYGRMTESQKISQLLREIRNIYQDAGIPTVHPENIRLKIKSLVKTCKAIISTRKLATENQRRREIEFKRKIGSLFEISAIEPLAVLPDSDEDLSDPEIVDADWTEESEDSEEDTEDFEPPKKRTRISTEMLKKINSECSQNASYRVMSTFIKIGIEIAGGSPHDYSISKSQLQSQLSKIRSSTKDDKLEILTRSNSPLFLQFDTKKCSKLNKRHLGSELRLVIILRSETNVVTLGPFTLNNHRAETCALQIISVITEYNLQNRIVAMGCDTESTNTGIKNGICARIEDFLERNLLYFMCRHHIFDLMLKHVGQLLFGSTSAPTFDYGCQELKTAWETLCLDSFSRYIDEEETLEGILYEDFRENAIEILQIQNENRQIRDDYAELTDLALKFFGRSTVANKRFMVPSAVSNARWMARAIYVLKCYLFRDQLNIEDPLLSRLRRFSLFISAVYVKYWNWSSNVFNSPSNDLHLLQELEKYSEVDSEISKICIKSHCRHLNYLSDELVVLCLFSNQVTDEEKEKIRFKLQTEVEGVYEQRTKHSIQYEYKDEKFSELELHDFVTHHSMFLFHTLNADVTFLNENAKDWNDLESYQRTRALMKNLFVAVNDSAERALSQTAFAINNQKARTEENLQNLLTSKLDT